MSNIDQRDKLVFYTEKDMKFPLKKHIVFNGK